MKNLATEIYNYKGLQVKRIDSIKNSQFGTRSAYADRDWYVNGIKGHTYKLNGEVKLAFYDVPASKGGNRKILGSFNPEVSFHIEQSNEMRALVYELTGKVVIGQVTETDF